MCKRTSAVSEAGANRTPIFAAGTTNQAKLRAVREVVSDFKDCFGADGALRSNGTSDTNGDSNEVAGTNSTGVEVLAVKAESGVADQPLSRRETIAGARNRAEAAWKQASSQDIRESGNKGILAFGIESGIWRYDDITNPFESHAADDPSRFKENVEGLPCDGWFNGVIVSCFDGECHKIGVSCGSEIPKKLMKVIFSPERQEKSGQSGHGEEHQVVSHGCCTLGTAEKVLGMVSQQPATRGQKLGETEGLIGFLTKGRLDRTSTTKHALVCALSSCLPEAKEADDSEDSDVD